MQILLLQRCDGSPLAAIWHRRTLFWREIIMEERSKMEPVRKGYMPDNAVSGTSSARSAYFRVRFWRVLAVTWLAYVGYVTGRRPFSVCRSEIERETGISRYTSGMVDTAFLIAYTVGQLMFGSYIKGRWSTRKILAGGVLLSGVSCALLSFVSAGELFVVIWFLSGLVQAVGWATCITIVSPWLMSHERGMVMGLWGTNQAVGGVVGNALTSFVLGYTSSWRVASMVDAVLLFVVGSLILLLGGDHPNKHSFLAPGQESPDLPNYEALLKLKGTTQSVDGEILAPQDTAQRAGAAPAGSSLSLMSTLAIPGVCGIAFSYFFHKLVRYSLIFWLPYYYTKELQYTPATAGYVSSVLDVGGVLGSVASGVFSDYYGSGKKRALSSVLLVAPLILSLLGFVFTKALLAQSVLYCGLVAFSCGFFAFAVDSLMTGAMLQDFAERQGVAAHVGAISGVIGGVGTAGSVLQGYVTVALSDQSWATLFASLSMLSVVASALMWYPVKLERHQNAVAKHQV